MLGGWGVLGVIDLVLLLTNLAKPLIKLAVFREAAKNIPGEGVQFVGGDSSF